MARPPWVRPPILAAALALAAACLPAVGPSVEFAICVAQLELREPAHTPVMQLIADAFVNCGQDIPAIFSALADSHKNDPAFMAELQKAKQHYDEHPDSFQIRLGAIGQRRPR